MRAFVAPSPVARLPLLVFRALFLPSLRLFLCFLLIFLCRLPFCLFPFLFLRYDSGAFGVALASAFFFFSCSPDSSPHSRPVEFWFSDLDECLPPLRLMWRGWLRTALRTRSAATWRTSRRTVGDLGCETRTRKKTAVKNKHTRSRSRLFLDVLRIGSLLP